MNYVNNMLELIGNTPLLKLNKVAKDVPANVFVKLEYLNPSGSYKDRMALAMVEAAEKGLTWNQKKLNPGGIVADASAGNTAPALAFVSAVKGYRAIFCVYAPMLRGNSTRLKIIGAFGADVCACSSPSDFLSAEEIAQIPEEAQDLSWVIAGKAHMYRLEVDDPDVIWVDQIYNPYNYIGQKGIGFELYDQLDGEIDAWGCSVGSGATLFGVTLALKEKGVNPFTFGVIPYGSENYYQLQKPNSKKGEYELSKLRRKLIDSMGVKKWQTEKSINEVMFDAGYPEEFFGISAEEARDMANRLCTEEGIYCGMSSGANVCVAMKIAERMKRDQNVVTVIVDRRDRYLGEFPNDVYIV